jgi:hypothetical protein
MVAALFGLPIYRHKTDGFSDILKIRYINDIEKMQITILKTIPIRLTLLIPYLFSHIDTHGVKRANGLLYRKVFAITDLSTIGDITSPSNRLSFNWIISDKMLFLHREHSPLKYTLPFSSNSTGLSIPRPDA